MQLRGLLVAVLGAVIAAGLVVWSNKAKEAEAKKPPAETSPKLVSVPEADIQQVEIARKGGEKTVVRRSGESWEITSPAAYKADKDAVTSMISTLASLASDKLVEEKPANLGEFGLAEPSLVVTLSLKDGKTTRVLIGDETPTSSGSFAKTEPDAKVYTIASWNKTSIDKSAKDLRDKRLLTFDSDKLVRVELTAKNTTTEFARNAQNEWQILKPGPYRADGFQVEEVIRKLKDAKLDTSISDEEAAKAPAAFAGAAPLAVAAVTDNTGSQKLEVRKSKDGKYYARSSVVEGVYSLPSDTATGLEKSTDDFRNKKVLDFGFNEPTKIDYRDAGRSLFLSKSGEKWWHNGKEQDAISVQAFIDKLRDLTATNFTTGPLPAAAVQVTVVSNDGKRTEKVALAKRGEKWYAQRENETTLYEITPANADELQRAAGSVKEPAPPPKDTQAPPKK